MRSNRCVKRCHGSVNACNCASCRFSNDFENRALSFFNSCPYLVIPEEFVYSFVHTVRDIYPQKAYSVLLSLAFSVQEDVNEKRMLANV